MGSFERPYLCFCLLFTIKQAGASAAEMLSITTGPSSGAYGTWTKTSETRSQNTFSNLFSLGDFFHGSESGLTK